MSFFKVLSTTIKSSFVTFNYQLSFMNLSNGNNNANASFNKDASFEGIFG